MSAVAESVREARIETAKRIIHLAQERRCDFVLIAGDLFDSNAVSNELVYAVLHVLEKAAPIPVYILPGNHDFLSPGSVYQRTALVHPPSNIHVLRDGAPVYLLDGTVALLPAPVTQKRSERDPTADFPETPAAKYRIGVAHGSLQIEGKYQPDDHPIALDAAARGQLDYLALGHWHSYLGANDETIMVGTPEPMGFGDDSGSVALVELRAGEAIVERFQVNALTWIDHLWELQPDMDILSARWAWEPRLSEDTLLRLRVSGYSTGEMDAELEELASWLRARLLHLELDTTQLQPEITRGALHHLAASHPFLGGMLSDLAQLALMADPLGGHQAAAAGDGSQSITLTSGQHTAATDHSGQRMILDNAALRKMLHEIEDDPLVIKNAIRFLAQLAQEVST